MIQLRKNLPYRNKHPFFLQKKVNLILSQRVVVGKVIYINMGIVFILTARVTI